MSAYRLIECEIYEGEHIIEALVEMGIPRSCIEVHDTPQALQGYTGDTRSTKGNIIVRRKHVNKHLSGGSSNDLGFELRDGKYAAHVSNYDQGWWNRKQDRFMQVAAASQAIKAAKKRGYRVTKTEVEGKIKIKLKKSY